MILVIAAEGMAKVTSKYQVTRRGIADDSVRVPHQAIVEFVTEILTEDLQHDRLHGAVWAVNPFLGSR